MKKTTALGYMNWKKGRWCAYQMLRLFKWGLTNQGIVLKTTIINTYWALTKERESLTRAYAWSNYEVQHTRCWYEEEEREALLTDRVNAKMSQWKGVKERHSDPWCECSLIGENLWGLPQLRLCQKWYRIQVLVVKRRILMQHELVKSEKH